MERVQIVSLRGGLTFREGQSLLERDLILEQAKITVKQRNPLWEEIILTQLVTGTSDTDNLRYSEQLISPCLLLQSMAPCFPESPIPEN